MKFKLVDMKHMRKHIAAVVFLVATFAPSVGSARCVCPYPALPYLYNNSTRIFLGEVVGIELVTTNPVNGQEVTYAATIKPLELFKGTSNADVRVTFETRYMDPTPLIPIPVSTVVDPAFGERTLTIVTSGSCGPSPLMAGQKYYIFENQGQPLTYSGCWTERIVNDNATTVDAMRSLRDAR
jgi:hypothetical protein